MIRQCGDCQLCCTLLAVREIKKLAGQKCPAQKFKVGCKVYNSSAMPPSCSMWSCRWLVNDDMADQSRPDRSHVVVDIMPDFVDASDDTGMKEKLPVLQVWCDPKHRDAHMEPKFREYLDRQGMLVLVRFSATEAEAWCPPSISDGLGWFRVNSTSSGKDHSGAEIIQALAEMS